MLDQMNIAESSWVKLNKSFVQFIDVQKDMTGDRQVFECRAEYAIITTGFVLHALFSARTNYPFYAPIRLQTCRAKWSYFVFRLMMADIHMTASYYGFMYSRSHVFQSCMAGAERSNGLQRMGRDGTSTEVSLNIPSQNV